DPRRTAIRTPKPRHAVRAISTAGVPGQPRDRTNDPVGPIAADLADDAVGGVRDINISTKTHRDAVGLEKPRIGVNAINAARAASQACNRGDYPVRTRLCQPSNRVIAIVRKKNRTCAVRYDAARR